MILAKVAKLFRGKTKNTKWCEICGYFTNGRKPLCTDHVFYMPYVKKVLERITQREIDLTATEIVDDSSIGWEILNQIRFREAVSVKRLQKDHLIPEVLIQAYIDLFVSLGLCEMFYKRDYVWAKAL